MAITWMRFQMMRTWTSFPLSLLPLPHALAAGAVLGNLPVPSSSHIPPGCSLLVMRSTEPQWPFMAQCTGHGCQPRVTGGTDLQTALTWCFSCQKPPSGSQATGESLQFSVGTVSGSHFNKGRSKDFLWFLCY